MGDAKRRGRGEIRKQPFSLPSRLQISSLSLSLSAISVPAMQPVVTELKRWTEATSRSENGKQFHSGIERGKNKDLRASLNVPVT